MHKVEVNKLSAVQRLNLIRQCEALLSKGGNKGETHYQLGVLHNANGSVQQAVKHLKAAAKLDKRNSQILAELAKIYASQNEFAQARKYARKLAELNPRDEATLIFQADLMEKSGNHTQALAAWQRLAKLFPGNAKNFQNLSACLRTLGRWEEAAEVNEKVLELDPLNAPTLYLVANSSKHDKETSEQLLASIEQSIGREEDKIDLSNLHYSAGKLLSDLGRYQEAMHHYAKANRSDEVYSLEKLKIPFDGSKLTFTKQMFTSKSKFGSSSDAPIFVLGMPRSGTTLVESLLGGHSKITAKGELAFTGSIAARVSQMSAEPAAFRKLIEALSPDDIQSIYEYYLESVKDTGDLTAHFTDKMPHNFLRIGLIKIAFPHAKIIHCRRHPIDNCLSLYTNSMIPFHNHYKSDLETLGLYYRQYLQLMEFWRAEVPGGFHEVFYEDVVANTELNARNMIDYLGLDWEDAVMERESSGQAVRTLSVWQVRQPVYTSSAGRWKKYEAYLAPLINALGGSVEAYERELQALSQAPTEENSA